MGLLDKAKTAAEQAAAAVQAGADQVEAKVHEVQAKRELERTYADLGRETFALLESGRLTEPDLTQAAERVRAAKRALEEDEQAPGAGAEQTPASGAGDGAAGADEPAA
jgi:hypothetical protein